MLIYFSYWEIIKAAGECDPSTILFIAKANKSSDPQFNSSPENWCETSTKSADLVLDFFLKLIGNLQFFFCCKESHFYLCSENPIKKGFLSLEAMRWIRFKIRSIFPKRTVLNVFLKTFSSFRNCWSPILAVKELRSLFLGPPFFFSSG